MGLDYDGCGELMGLHYEGFPGIDHIGSKELPKP